MRGRLEQKRSSVFGYEVWEKDLCALIPRVRADFGVMDTGGKVGRRDSSLVEELRIILLL